MDKIPAKLSLWFGILASIVVLFNAAVLLENRYTKQSVFSEFAIFTRVSFAEIYLEMTQERINRIEAIPEGRRKTWQTEEMLRLESIKEKQLRRLQGHKE